MKFARLLTLILLSFVLGFGPAAAGLFSLMRDCCSIGTASRERPGGGVRNEGLATIEPDSLSQERVRAGGALGSYGMRKKPRTRVSRRPGTCRTT